jgi:hypothetical protein
VSIIATPLFNRTFARDEETLSLSMVPFTDPPIVPSPTTSESPTKSMK